MRRSTRASDVRAPRRAGGTRSMRFGRALFEREPALLAAQGRAPKCQPWPSLREVACACTALARHCARSLLGGGAARALPTCTRRDALAAVAPCATKANCASRTAVSLGARPCSDVRAAASKRAAYLRMCQSKKSANRAHSLSLLGGGAARALPTCARRAALADLAPCATEAHCASGTAISLGARPCSDVRAAASKRAAYLRICASKKSANRAHSLSLLGGGAARALPTCVRRAALAALAPCV
jgi:F0F1-type ATP synthase assembly protein I